MKIGGLKLFLAAGFCAATIALPSHAATFYDTYADWEGNATSEWLATAQTITAPVDKVLVNYRFALAPRSSPGSVQFDVFLWGPTGPSGASLYSVVVPWDAGGDVDILGINLPLTTGLLYGMNVDLFGYSSNSVHFNGNQMSYSDGNGWWYDGTWNNLGGLNHKFRAEFSADVPEPSSVLLVAAGLALLLMRRHRLQILR